MSVLLSTIDRVSPLTPTISYLVVFLRVAIPCFLIKRVDMKHPAAPESNITLVGIPLTEKGIVRTTNNNNKAYILFNFRRSLLLVEFSSFPNLPRSRTP